MSEFPTNSNSDESALASSVSIADYAQRLAAEIVEIHADVQSLAEMQSQNSECSYSAGYATQPVYACLTCHPSGDVGFCFACSVHCHSNHDIIDLYDKRDFRCDCGSTKARRQGRFYQCGLAPIKYEENSLNHYNHNFVGKYCHCDGVYREGEEVMIPCLECEDWFHMGKCIEPFSGIEQKTNEINSIPNSNSTPTGNVEEKLNVSNQSNATATDVTAGDEPEIGEGQEFICRNCIKLDKYKILLPYFFNAQQNNFNANSNPIHSPSPPPQSASASVVSTFSSLVDSSSSISDLPSGWTCQCKYINLESAPTCGCCENKKPRADQQQQQNQLQNQTPRKRKAKEIQQTPQSQSAVIPCTRLTATSSIPPRLLDTFLPPEFRSRLCRCADCIRLYDSNGVGSLIEATADEPAEAATPGTDPSRVAQPNQSAATDSSAAAVQLAPTMESLLARLPPDLALARFGQFQSFVSNLRSQFRALDGGQEPVVITRDMALAMVENARQLADQNTTENFTDPDQDGDNEFNASSSKKPRHGE